MKLEKHNFGKKKIVIIVIVFILLIAVIVTAFCFGRKSVEKTISKKEQNIAVENLFNKAKENGFSSLAVLAEESDYDYKIIKEGVVITGFKNKDNKATIMNIPDVIEKKPVIGIGDNAFANNLKIENVTLGSNVSAIGEGAFENCTRLKVFVCNKKLGEIGKNAFNGCASLSVLSLNQGLSSIKLNALQGTGLRKIVVPKSVNFFEDPFGKTKSAVTVYGEKGSYIENWAEINSVRFSVYNFSNENETPNPIITVAESTEPTTKKSKIEIDENAVAEDEKLEETTVKTSVKSTKK